MDKKKELGLTNKEVLERTKAGKVNGDFTARSKSIGHIVITNVFTLFNVVSTFLAISLVLVGSYKNMLFMGVVFWNTIIGLVQEIRAKTIVDRLSLISAPKASVIREGKTVLINQEDIVLDDVFVLKTGNQICADSIIIEGECEVDESLLSGESNSIIKKAGDMILSGSYIQTGDVIAKVVNVGKDNYVNKIIGSIKYIKKPNSQILKTLRYIIRFVSICLVPIAIAMFFKQSNLQENTKSDVVVKTVASLVGLIPAGLLLLTTVVLAVSVIRLGKKKTLVQELYCIETLATVDTLCLDKTGTLTTGSLKHNSSIVVDENNDNIEFYIREFLGALKDNNSTYDALKTSYNISETLQALKVIKFSSKRKWSLADFEGVGCLILGAAEYVLKDDYEKYKKQIEELSEKGYRVLVFAKSGFHIEEDSYDLPKEVKALMFLLLEDEIRKDAKETIEFFYSQGVDVRVISGDNPITVAKLSKKAGLVDCSYIDTSNLSKDELIKAVDSYKIFGRVKPDQKLEIIKRLKALKRTVAMIGDGVNDVLALKEADCSIAMQAGSDAARNVSQIVLLDSDFSAVPHIVAEGRRTINNIQRSASLYLVKTIYAFLLATIFLFLPLSYPFSPIQLTIIGTLGIGIPSFILALEPNLNRIRGVFLVNVLRYALPGGLLIAVNVIMSSLIAYTFGFTGKSFGTIATYLTAYASLLVLIHITRPHNKLRDIMLLVLTTTFVLVAVFLPEIYDFVPLTPIAFLAIIIMSVINTFVYIGLSKIVDLIFGTKANEYRINLSSIHGERNVIVLNEVLSKDYKDVTLQMIGNKAIRAEHVAFLKEINLNQSSKENVMTHDAKVEMAIPVFSGNIALSLTRYLYEAYKNKGIKKEEFLINLNEYLVRTKLINDNSMLICIEIPLPKEYFIEEIPKVGSVVIVVYDNIYHVVIDNKASSRNVFNTVKNYIINKYQPEITSLIAFDTTNNEVWEQIFIKRINLTRKNHSHGTAIGAVALYLSKGVEGEKLHFLKIGNEVLECKINMQKNECKSISLKSDVKKLKKSKVLF